MQSYMSNRSQSVIWNNNTSKPLDLTHGVPQGSILGPLLSLVMVADLPEYVTHGCVKNVTLQINTATVQLLYSQKTVMKV